MSAEAMTDATKRKEPEPEAKEAKEPDKEAKATDSKAEPKGAGSKEEPDAKRAKTEPTGKPTQEATPKVVRKQVEYYLSDENLRHDKFFHEKIAGDEGGWLEMSLILSCNKMKAMGATKEDVIKALEESKLELKDGNTAVRRPGNAPLPKLEAKPQHHQKKSSAHAHDGGAVVVFKEIPAEQSWVQIKEALLKKVPNKTAVWHASEVNDKGECFVVAAPFDGDVAWFKELELEVGGKKLKCEICTDDVLQNVLKKLPKHVKDKRDNAAKRRQKERNKPIVVGNQNFVNVGALRGKVKEIMNSRSDGEQLKPDGTDFKLIKALMEFHPKGAEKSAGLTGIKVAKSPFQESRCFYIIKGDVEEDVSMMKCIAAVEQNPPYAKVPEKEKKDDKAPKDKADTSKTVQPASSSAATADKPAAEKPATEAKPVEAKAASEEKPAEVAKPAEQTKPAEATASEDATKA